MSSSLRKFAIQYSHFFTGSVLSLMLGLISLPILTRFLTVEEYGIMGLVSTYLLIAVALAKAGLSDGIIRYYKPYEDTSERRDIFASTVAVRGLLFSSVAVVLYLASLPFMLKLLKLDNVYLVCFMIMSVYLFVRPLNIIILNILRITERTIFFNLINLIGRAVSIGLALSLLLYFVENFYGYFIGLASAEFLVFAALLYWFLKNYRVSFGHVSRELTVKLVKFGIPLLITEMSYLLLSYADRYMIAAYRGAGELGLYSVGYNLASYIGDLIMFSLSYAVIPIYVGIYQKDGRAETEEFLTKCLNYLVAAVIPMFFIYTAISKDLFITLASIKYEQAAIFSPIILAGSLLLGLNNILNAGLYLQKKTTTILTIMLSSLAVNILLNALLLPTYGITGAAIATLAACATGTLLTVVMSFRHIKVGVSLYTITYYSIFSFIAYFGLMLIDLGSSWSNLFLKLVLSVIIFVPVILYREKVLFHKAKNFFSKNSLKTVR
jgi:O-antigen/teichoic acid export membrane protein